MLSWSPHVGLENACCNLLCSVLEFILFWEPSDVEVAAVDSDWNKNDFQVVWDLKKPPLLNRRYWHLCSACIAISSMLCGRSTLWLCWTVVLCFLPCSRLILESCLTISLAYKCPTKWMNGWMNYSRHELTIFAYMFICCFITMVICIIFLI